MRMNEICTVIDWQPVWCVVWPLTRRMPGEGWPWLEKQKVDGYIMNGSLNITAGIGIYFGLHDWSSKRHWSCRSKNRKQPEWTTMIPNPITYHTAGQTGPKGPDLTGVKMAATVTIRWLVWLLGLSALWCWAGLSCLFKNPLPKRSRLFRKGQEGHGGGWAAVFRQKFAICECALFPEISPVCREGSFQRPNYMCCSQAAVTVTQIADSYGTVG